MKNRLIFIPAASIIFILFLVGTFCDLQISQSIANINSFFPKAIAGLSLFPLCITIAFVGGTFIRLITLKRYKAIWQNILIGLFALVCIAFSTYLFGKEMTSLLAFNLKKILIIPIGLVTSIPGGILGYFLYKYIDSKDHVKKVAYLSVILFVSFGIIYVMKYLAPRARYIFVSTEQFKDYYRPWYQPSLTKEMIDALFNTSYGKEAYQSFPSGHSSSAMLTMMLLSSAPLFIDKLKNKQILLFYIGFTWYLFIGFTRIYAGAHYLSDVTFSGLIDLGVFYIGNEIYVRKLLKGEEECLEK